jgi:AraC-like DNA-binding protein
MDLKKPLTVENTGMPKPEQPWKDSAVEMRTIALSAADPLQVSHGVHRKIDKPRYDMHYGLELGVVLSGAMKRFYKTWETELKPGGVWLCGMWEPHGWEPVKVPCEILVFVILPQSLTNTGFEGAARVNWTAPFTAAPESRPQVTNANRAVMLSLGKRLAARCDSNSAKKAAWLKLGLFEILLTLMENWTPPQTVVAPPAGAFTRIHKAVELIFQSHHAVTVREASRLCGMGRNAFSELFTSLMGISFPKFALRYRLSGAASQIARSDDAVKTVAADWGFTDASHLHRAFVQHYGCSPAEYRKRTAKL